MNTFDKFENVLLKYGPKTLIDVRKFIEELEFYEDCNVINNVLKKHNIEYNPSIEDFVYEFWKLGFSGRTIFENSPYYYKEAIEYLYGNIDDINNIKQITV